MRAFSVVEQYPFFGVVAENHSSSLKHACALFNKNHNCHMLKQIAQHGNKLKLIQNRRKIRTDLRRIRNGSKTDNEILLNGNGSFFWAHTVLPGAHEHH